MRNRHVAPFGWLLVALVAGLHAVPAAAADDEGIESEIDSLKETIETESAGDTSVAGGSSPDAGPAESPPPAAGDENPPERAERGGAAAASLWSLYRDPILCALLAGAALGFLGVYVVARRIVFVSASLSQVSALGITLGFLATALAGLSGPVEHWLPLGVAVVLSLVVVALLTWAEGSASLPQDALLGVAFVVPMALVLVLGPYIPQEMHEIESILHGSAVVVRRTDLYAVAVAGAVVLATQLAAFRAFVFATLDPTVARTQGLPVGKLDAILYGSVAVMIGLVTRALGALPTFALTVLPAVGAIRLKVGLRSVFVAASIAGAVAGVGGFGLAYAMNWSVGASQTLVAAGVMVVLRGVGWLMDGR